MQFARKSLSDNKEYDQADLTSLLYTISTRYNFSASNMRLFDVEHMKKYLSTNQNKLRRRLKVHRIYTPILKSSIS